MITVNHPANRVRIPMRFLGEDLVTPAVRPADLQMFASNMLVGVFETPAGYVKVWPASPLNVGESVMATVTIKSQSLNIQDTALVTFNGPLPPPPVAAVDLDEPNAETFTE